MAIAFDAASGGATTAASSLTFAHTCTGSDLILFVGAFNGTNNVTGVTYNGVAMTLVDTAVAQAGVNYKLFYLINPATGANNVVISTDVASNVLRGVSTSYTGSAQSGQPDSFSKVQGAQTYPLAISTTVVAANCWLVMAGGNVDDGQNAGTNTTSRVAVNSMEMFDSNATVGTGAQVLNATSTVSPTNSGFVIVSLAPAGGAAGTARDARLLTLLGVG